jgi:hypothetical protein
MTSAEIKCSQCHSPLPEELWNRPEFNPCPSCRASFLAETFPALTRPALLPAAGRLIVEDDEAGCFFHPRKRAEVSCSMCGRFLCQLCDIDLQGNHICPHCLQIAQSGRAVVSLEKRRTVYDSASLSIALLPLLVWPLTLLTAPLAVVVALISFKKPNSLVSRSHYRAWLAILIGSLQIALWTWALIMLI